MAMTTGPSGESILLLLGVIVLVVGLSIGSCESAVLTRRLQKEYQRDKLMSNARDKGIVKETAT